MVAAIFLNYHSTLIRDLRDDYCIVSSKANGFYRYIWPWIKLLTGVCA